MSITLRAGIYKDRNTVDNSYDWTVLPAAYGSIYDAQPAVNRQSGGYVPLDGSTAGRPSGSALLTTLTGTAGLLKIASSDMTQISTTATANAATNLVTATAHGLVDGDPVYFTSLTGGAGLVTMASVMSAPSLTARAGWYAVANATANTFSLRECHPCDSTLPVGTTLPSLDRGLFYDTDITTNYTAMTLMKGVRYDQTDFQCYIQPSLSSSAGLVLITRSRFSGPAAATHQGGMIFAPTGWNGIMWVEADNECVPQAYSTYQDFTYAQHLYSFRSAYKWIIDGHGDLGNCHIFGRSCGKLHWEYPDVATPSHTDGTHNDAGGQDVNPSGSAVHVYAGCYIDGDVDHNNSSTTDPSGHPIVADTTTAGLLIGTTNSTDFYFTGNDCRNGGLAINVANANFSNLGYIFGNTFHKSDSDKQLFSPTLANIPNQLSGNASTPTVTIHVYCPTSGVNANHDETGAAVTNINPAANATLTWP